MRTTLQKLRTSKKLKDCPSDMVVKWWSSFRKIKPYLLFIKWWGHFFRERGNKEERKKTSLRPQLEKRSSACKARHAFILYNIDTATTADTFRLGLRVLSVCSCGVWRNKEAYFFIALAFSLKKSRFYVPQRSSPKSVLGVLGPNVTDAWVHVVDMWSRVLGIVVISEGASEKRCRQQKKTSKLIEQINIKSLTSVFLTASVVVGFAKWQNRAWSQTNLNTFCSAKVACKTKTVHAYMIINMFYTRKHLVWWY